MEQLTELKKASMLTELKRQLRDSRFWQLEVHGKRCAKHPLNAALGFLLFPQDWANPLLMLIELSPQGLCPLWRPSSRTESSSTRILADFWDRLPLSYIYQEPQKATFSPHSGSAGYCCHGEAPWPIVAWEKKGFTSLTSRALFITEANQGRNSGRAQEQIPWLAQPALLLNPKPPAQDGATSRGSYGDIFSAKAPSFQMAL